MADSEKLTALKKAYADIILNSAKEAAARIMVSERKAQRYQRELFAAKDESLRMLLRLKQMLDSKVNEAEMSSLSQQRRIEELEAQLGEAEDIVKDLRTELRELQDELEKVKQPLGEGQIATLANPTKDNRLSTSCAGYETKSGACDANHRYAEINTCKENCFACTPDLASIVIRRKETELYRNGCTQRIRAFERNLLDARQSDGVKNQGFIGDEDKEMCAQLTEKAPDTVKDIEADNRTIKRRRKMRNQSVFSGTKTQIFVEKEAQHICKNFLKKTHITSDLKRSRLGVKNGGAIPRRIRSTRAAKYGRKKENKGFPNFPLRAVDNNVQTQEDSRTNNIVSEKDPEPVVDPKSPPTANKSGPEEVIKIKTEFPACKSGFEAACVLSNSNSKEPGASEALSPVEPVKNKFLKYTFQRKRKKEFPSSQDSDSSTARKMEGEENDSKELQKSGLVTESSRDSRRLAQVARQLISLSEKKWR